MEGHTYCKPFIPWIPVVYNLHLNPKKDSTLLGARTSRCFEGKKLNFPADVCTRVLRKISIRPTSFTRALFNTNLGAETNRTCACTDVQKLNLIGQVGFCKTIVRNSSGGFSSAEQYCHSNMLLLTNCEVHTAKYSDRSSEVRTE